jgi:hypothetical protein
MNLHKKWIQHLKENNMGYSDHMIFAIYYSTVCLMASISLLIHAILPCFLQNTGSDLVNRLNKVFKNSEDNE